jgi:hypothetical protein
MSYGDYVEQLMYRLFLKMADERSQQPFNRTSSIPKKYDGNSLLASHAACNQQFGQNKTITDSDSWGEGRAHGRSSCETCVEARN